MKWWQMILFAAIVGPMMGLCIWMLAHPLAIDEGYGEDDLRGSPLQQVQR